MTADAGSVNDAAAAALMMSGPLLMFRLAGAFVVYWPRGTGARPCHEPEDPAKHLSALAHQGAGGAAPVSATATASVVISARIPASWPVLVLEVFASRWGDMRLALACTRHGITKHSRRRTALRVSQPAPASSSGALSTLPAMTV